MAVAPSRLTAASRAKAASAGAAMPDGSFPIRNQAELESAIKMRGQSKTYSKAQIEAHIRKRAAALDLTTVVNKMMAPTGRGSTSGS